MRSFDEPTARQRDVGRGMNRPLAIVRGGGELGSAVGRALALGGMRVLVLDRPLPGALRLGVAFAAAAVAPDGRAVVEGVTAVRTGSLGEIEAAWARGDVALMVEDAPAELHPAVLVDARMRGLSEPLTRLDEAPLVVGIGPGFEAGRDVHWVVESNRGPRLGLAIDEGRAETHTGVPGEVLGQREARILRAPRAGRFVRSLELGAFVEVGDTVAAVEGEPVLARLAGMVRGLKLTGVEVGAGHKVGDVDPRRQRALLRQMTDKAQAVARGVLGVVVGAGLLPATALERVENPTKVESCF